VERCGVDASGLG